uniref:Myb-like domain-containing protein n=1 Tax=Brassica oleracea var. oleracea TaxID=109376 RepID=A0A0D3BEJ6_BRAOL
MDSRHPYSQSSSYLGLLNSQHESVLHENFSYESFPSGASEIPPFSSQQADAPILPEDTPVDRRERMKWTPDDDEVLISVWLNTSKDAVVGNDQKSGTFWKRVGEYVAASPHGREGGEKREHLHCKQRWHKINDLTNKFCGAFAAAERQITSGQNDNDVLKVAHDIFYSDHKSKFTLEHAWCVLRYEQKWLNLNTPKATASSKRRIGETGPKLQPPMLVIMRQGLKDEDEFDSIFDDYFENLDLIPEPKERKNVFLSRETGKKATRSSGMITFAILQHTLPTIRQLAYGGGADTVDEYVRLAETTARKCLHNFTAGIISLFGDEYLRRPTPEDLERLLHIGEERGFPGMIGSIDCMHWEWKNCPTAWKGMYSRGTGKPTIVLEVVASYDLWIWHAFFGAPGTMNDLNILDRSPVFDDIINGNAPQVNLYVNGTEYHLGYYLTAGIYPKWATFVQSIRLPQGEKNSLFAKTQEAVRKDVERAFGVLQARFAVVKNPSKLWDKDKIANIMRACIILHNMVVEDERSSFTQYDVFEFQQGEDVDDTFSVDMLTNLGNTIDRRASVRNRQAHQQLKNDLIENIWA